MRISARYEHIVFYVSRTFFSPPVGFSWRFCCSALRPPLHRPCLCVIAKAFSHSLRLSAALTPVRCAFRLLRTKWMLGSLHIIHFMHRIRCVPSSVRASEWFCYGIILPLEFPFIAIQNCSYYKFFIVIFHLTLILYVGIFVRAFGERISFVHSFYNFLRGAWCIRTF